jgi:hypothetical protein
MKAILIGVFLIVGVTLVSYVYANSNDYSFTANENWHRQHHIEMHGNDEGFEEMHESCEQTHENNYRYMQEHHKLIHGGY